MEQKDHWDAHTRGIVEGRLQQSDTYQSLNKQEVKTLQHLCEVILDDSRVEVLSYVVHYFDTKLSSNIGEAQRKKGLPRESDLIRKGLQALDGFCNAMYGNTFDLLEEKIRQGIVDQLCRGQFHLEAGGLKIPTQDFFSKILTESVSAYYSHPTVWSDIGYAGPAYPRGYVRSEWGLTDPWEAKRTDA
jgi:Gluconate 2-dehydrogenase subunit 3